MASRSRSSSPCHPSAPSCCAPTADCAALSRPPPSGLFLSPCATFDGLGIECRVFSANADRIELCLFDPAGRREIARLDLPECTDEIWHGYLPNARPGLIYGYRATALRAAGRPPVQSAQAAARSLRRQLAGDLRWSDACSAIASFAAGRSLVRPPRQRPGHAKGRGERRFSIGATIGRPTCPGQDGHLRDAFARHDHAAARHAGQRARHLRGARRRRRHRYLRPLGVTAVELLPIHAFSRIAPCSSRA